MHCISLEEIRQNQPNLAAEDLYEILIDFDSLDCILLETDEYRWSTAGQNPLIKMASKMATIILLIW